MQVNVRARPAALRCYYCGSPEVVAICHHCGNPMCSAHGLIVPPLRWFTENREYTRLPLNTWPIWGRPAAHCHLHAHSSPNYRRLMLWPGLLLLAIGGIFAVLALEAAASCFTQRPPAQLPPVPAAAEVLRDPTVDAPLATGICYTPEATDVGWRLGQWFLVIAFSGVTAAAGAYLNRERVAADLANWQPPVPLAPISRGLLAVETVHGQVTLDATGEYRASWSEIQGELDPRLEFTALDRERLRAYRDKYGLSEVETRSYSAGYLVLTGAPRLRLNVADPAPGRSRMLALRGTVGEHAYLAGRKGRSDRHWAASLTYQVLQDQARNASAATPSDQLIRLLPVFFSSGSQQQLGIELQLPASSALLAGQWKAEVERLTLLSPVDLLGRPASDGSISYDKASECYQVEWRNVPVHAAAGASVDPVFVVTYDNPLVPAATVHGRLELRLPYLLSGLAWVRYFSNHGYPIERPRPLDLAAATLTAPLGLPSVGRRVSAWVDRLELSGRNLWRRVQSLGQPAPARVAPSTKAGTLDLPDLEPPEPQGPATEPQATVVPAEYQNDMPFDGFTRVIVDFELALNSLARHELYIHPLPPIRVPDMQADTTLVRLLLAAIVNDVSDNPNPAVHIRHVIENEAQAGERHANQRRQLWDISGRQYHSIFPVDFHLVLASDVESGNSSSRGECVVDLSVQAAVCDAETRKAVDDTAVALEAAIRKALSAPR